MSERTELLLAECAPLEEVAKELGVHVSTLRRWYALGELDGKVKIGKKVMIHVPTARAGILARANIA